MTDLETTEKLKKQLEEDTEAFASLLRRADPLPPSHVRIITSSILRKWLIEGLINDLARKTGFRFTFPALDTRAVFEAIRHDQNIRYFCAGGIILDGRAIQGVTVSDAPFTGTLA